MAAPATPTNPAPRGRGRVPRIDSVAVGLLLLIFLSEAAIGVLLLAINEEYPTAKLHAHHSLVGWAFSFYFGSKVVGQPLAGWLADRTDPRRVLTTGALLSIPGIVLMEAVHEQALYVAMWGVFGFSLAVVWPCTYAIVGRRFRASLQGRLFALISMAQIAGTAVGAGSGGVLIDYVSYTAAFAIAAGLMVGALVVTIAVVRGRVPGAATATPQDRLVLKELRSVGRIVNGRILLLGSMFAVISLGVSLIAPDLKPYGEHVLGLKYSSFLLLLVLPAVIAGALIVPSGYIADRFGRAIPMVLGLLIFAVMLGTLAQTQVAVVAMLLATAASAGYVLCLPALSATQLDLTTAETRGAVTGFTASIQAVGGVVGPPVGGSLTDSFGPLAPFRAASALMLFAFLIALVYTAATRGLYDAKALRAQQ